LESPSFTSDIKSDIKDPLLTQQPKTTSTPPNSKYTRYNSTPSIATTGTINITIPSTTANSSYHHHQHSSSSSVSPVISNPAAGLISPNSAAAAAATIPMTRSATAKLIKQTTSGGQLVVDSAKLLPPPQASLVPPKNLFNDDDDDDDDGDEDNENEVRNNNTVSDLDDIYTTHDDEDYTPNKRISAHAGKNSNPSDPTAVVVKPGSGETGVVESGINLILNDQSFSSSVGSSCSDDHSLLLPKSIKQLPRLLLPPPPPPPPPPPVPRDLVIPGTVKTLAQLRQKIAEAKQASLKRRADQMTATGTNSSTSLLSNSKNEGSEKNEDELADDGIKKYAFF
jgi:hypothetical protein